MITISKNILLRLSAQANEADIYNDVKTADHLTKQIEKYANDAVRADDAKHTYSKEQLVEDLESAFWDAAVRIFDYYEETPDAKIIQEIVEAQAESFLETIENLIHKDVGAYEEDVPGEDKIIEREVSEPAFQIDDDEDEYIEEDDDEEK